ncbi:MAG: hypothetical protein Q4D26_10560 [Clostridia bacterium]|nr:hypothetical protein [Clostridia bacterium]
MKYIKKSDTNYMMMIGIASMFCSILCAWLRAVLGSMASCLSLIFFLIAVYSLLKVYTVLYEAYIHNTKKIVCNCKLKNSNGKDAVEFANNFARQLEAESEREFWLSNKA